MIVEQIIEAQGKLFQVKRRFSKDTINLDVEDGVKILKEYYHCDTMFKAKGYLWLCNEIKEVSYEEIKKE